MTLASLNLTGLAARRFSRELRSVFQAIDSGLMAREKSGFRSDVTETSGFFRSGAKLAKPPFKLRNSMHKTVHGALAIVFGTILALGVASARAEDSLPSWNDGAVKSAILDFVQRTTMQGGPDYLPPEERIATFDNDGTLWVEQPVYTQVVFAFARVRELAQKHPDWKNTEPFKSILSGNRAVMANFTIQDFSQVVAATHSAITVEEFKATVKKWLSTARHPRFNRLYTELAYQPMLELLRYYRANGFKTYIVTGGGQDFVRVFAEQVYGVPPEQVIGSAGKTLSERARTAASPA
jgi:phosphoglycolate phosphatase-like HAD superfamily hydrolase